MNREGASPVVAASVVSVDAAGDADSVAVASGAGEADSVAAGVSVDVDVLLDCCDATMPTRIATPRSTATRTLLDEPWRGAADGLAGAAAGFAGATGVVETFTRSREPVVGTGGITTEEAEDLRAGAFFATFFAVAFLTVAFFATFLTAAFLGAAFFATFLAVVFFATDFFATFFAAVFLAVDFFATDFFATFFAVVFVATFLGAAFLAVAFFFTATFISSDRMGQV
jgi:hypothetical protein